MAIFQAAASRVLCGEVRTQATKPEWIYVRTLYVLTFNMCNVGRLYSISPLNDITPISRSVNTFGKLNLV